MKILMIAAPGSGSGWARYTDDLSASLRESGAEVLVEYIAQPLRLKKHFLLSWLIAFKLCLKHRNSRVDVIHCVVEPYAFITYLLALLMRKPYLITFHGTYSISLLHVPWLNKIQRLAYGRASNLVAVSNYTRSRVLAELPDLNIAIIPNGIRRLPEVSRRELLQEHVIVGVGGLKHRKGYHLVLEALAKIKEKLNPFMYYIVGTLFDTEYVARLQSMIKQFGLEKEVVITGSMSDSELDTLYGRADLFVLTPVSDGLQFEGFGLVYLEANARGIPVVGMRGSGAEEAIKDGYNGLLAEAKSVDDIALKIKTIFKDKNYYEELSKNALEWAKEMQWTRTIKKYTSIYDVILNK